MSMNWPRTLSNRPMGSLVLPLTTPTAASGPYWTVVRADRGISPGLREGCDRGRSASLLLADRPR